MRPDETVWPMRLRTGVCLTLAVLLFSVIGSACAGQGGQASRDLAGPAGLKGKTVGVVSLADASTMETRYVLQKAYGLDTSQKGSTVRFVEVLPESLATELLGGQIDAAVLSQAGAFRLLSDGRFRVLSHISQEMKKLSGGPIASSVLLTYPDVAAQKPDALAALDRLLAQSIAYEQANERAVLQAVATLTGQDEAFLRWQAERQELPLGDLSGQAQERLLRTWQVAAALGDIDRPPDLTTVLFAPARQKSAAGITGNRLTISVALLDDPSRRAALYAIEQAIVASSDIDVNITYLAPSALAEAATTKQYDVIEALPLIVPMRARQDLGFIVLSAGADDLDSTLLFVRNQPSAP
jgi:ABC-type nitrate/sulfonate/bicarbonate transport system substrate-binding protein